MKKKLLTISLLIMVAVSCVAVVEASARYRNHRMQVFNGLEGIINDQKTDIKLNPAQLYNIEQNKFWADFYFYSQEDSEDAVLVAPAVVCQLDENNVLGGEILLADDRSGRNIYSFKAADGIKVNEDLILGGRVGIDSEDDDTDVILQGGGIYKTADNINVDGRIGIKDEEINLFLRGTKRISGKESLVGLVNFQDGLDYKRLAVGQNTSKGDALLSYGAELTDRNEITRINLAWGTELEFNDKFIGRAGGKYVVFESNDNVEDSTRLCIPQINGINVGLSYHYDEKTTVDLAYTPFLQLGNNSMMELGFSITHKF